MRHISIKSYRINILISNTSESLREEHQDKGGDGEGGEFGSGRPNNVFRCKFIVPDASEIIFDNRDPYKVKTIIQVSNKNEKARQKARDNIGDENPFDLLLYNVTEDKIKGNQTEKIPAENRTNVPMSRGAMDAYKSNSYGGKYGDFSIHSICTPILFTKQGTIGSFIYKEEYNHISKTKLQLFELNNERDVKRCV